MTTRLPGFVLAGAVLCWLLIAPLGASYAKGTAPASLDCNSLPCERVYPAASEFRPVEGASYWEALDASGDVLGWVALSTQFVDIRAYSGKPMVTLVGLDPKGMITGALVVYHSEPILLIGIPEKALHDFVDFYAGQSAQQRIVVGRASQPGAVSVDAISGATVTALVQNVTILETAQKLGVAVGVFETEVVLQGHFIEEAEPWSFQQMKENGALGRLVVTEKQMNIGDTDAPHVDLLFGMADAPQIGRSLLGERNYDYYMKQLAPGEHLFVIFNTASGSFKGSGFVRGGIFDRVRLQQGLHEITFRDTDYYNLPDAAAEDRPDIQEGGLFIIREGHADPGAPYELVFLGSRYDGRSAFSREFLEFTAEHVLPETIYVVDEAPLTIWEQAWLNRRVDTVILGVYFLFVIGVFSARRYTTANMQRLERLHLASMLFGFLVLGCYMSVQPSVTQILTAVGSMVGEWRWELFLSEPLIFISWNFIFIVSLIWGRGVFCGWVCPYGALTELLFKLGQKLKIPSFEFPDRIHLPLRHLRYVVLFVLIGVFLYDSALGEIMAEVEPFKSTFYVPAWNRPIGFLAWWLFLLGASVVMYRPFCRYLCPLGGGLALLSSPRQSGPKRRVFCTNCKICTRGCEPRAIRPNGTIDPRECLSCMECEAVYRDSDRCPPLIGLAILEGKPDLDDRERRKMDELSTEVADV